MAFSRWSRGIIQALMKELLRSFYHRAIVIPRIRRTYRHLSTADAFRRIYATKAWGNSSDFDSGYGSVGPVADKYCAFVARIVSEYNIKSVADLGCGDFQIGQRIAAMGDDYIGVDIVPELIDRNRQKFPNVRFECLNLVTDPLPAADLCLVRQVFQHLSNDEIAASLENIERTYRRALIAEHVPKRYRVANMDKPHGPDIRAYYGSGVFVDCPPFSRLASRSATFEMDEKSSLRVVLINSRR